MDELSAQMKRANCPPDDPAEVHSRRMFALIPTTIILILSILTYALRLYCRKKTGQRLGWDDILMGCGLLISFEPAICEYLCRHRELQPTCQRFNSDGFPVLHNGLGHHNCHVPEEQQRRFAVVSRYHLELSSVCFVNDF